MQVSANSQPIRVGDILWRNNPQEYVASQTGMSGAGQSLHSDKVNISNEALVLSELQKATTSIVRRYDVQDITPREMAKMSRELYNNGSISLKNHAFISFQPELNPSFNDTIGKFSHTTAQPDSPRNFLDEWQERLAEQTRSGASPEIVNNTREVVAILDNLAARRDNLVSQK